MRWNAHIFQREISDRIGLTRQYIGCCMDALQSRETIRRISQDRASGVDWPSTDTCFPFIADSIPFPRHKATPGVQSSQRAASSAPIPPYT